MSLKHIEEAFRARVQNWESQHFEKTEYGRRLSALKDIHKGERCFIVANGPSLAANDLNKLAELHEITFAMNRIYKIFPETKWRPDYYVCEDIKIFNEAIADINAIPAKLKFIPINHHWYNGINIEGALYFWANYDQTKKCPYGFSAEIEHQMDCQGTVTFTCINIAAYMGFKEIYLIGVDHNYRVIINEEGNQIVDENAKDYFCANYDADIQDTVVHDMGQNTRAYRNAKAYCDIQGIIIYNATRGGKLEVFPRVDFDSIFS